MLQASYDKSSFKNKKAKSLKALGFLINSWVLLTLYLLIQPFLGGTYEEISTKLIFPITFIFVLVGIWMVIKTKLNIVE